MNKDLFFLCTDPEAVNKILMENEGITLDEFRSEDPFASHPKPEPKTDTPTDKE